MSLPILTSSPRRAEITRSITDETGIDDAMIETLVRRFYAAVRADPLLGPVFATRITDWEPHLARMCAFWSSVALMSGRYHGQPMQMHLPLPIHGDHFDRWLALFEETANDVCPPAAVAHFMDRARRIAESLELGIAAQNGVMLGKGDRFRVQPVEVQLKGAQPVTTDAANQTSREYSHAD